VRNNVSSSNKFQFPKVSGNLDTSDPTGIHLAGVHLVCSSEIARKAYLCHNLHVPRSGELLDYWVVRTIDLVGLECQLHAHTPADIRANLSKQTERPKRLEGRRVTVLQQPGSEQAEQHTPSLHTRWL